jgi:DeoR family transcriptional regulator, aga operon transcriptional repressor
MLRALGEREFLRVRELGDMFGISEVTVRSDLNALAEEGHVRRLRGGAMIDQGAGSERPFEETRATHAAAKSRIAAFAASLVDDGEGVILDVGSTTTAVARALVARTELRNVSVFTNALNIALELEPAIPRFSVVVLGGTLRPLQHSLVDPLAGLPLAQIKAGVVFLGCNGVHPEGGVTNINLPEAQIKQRMLASARRRVVVADGSKIGRIELTRLCGVEDLDLLVTDDSADADAVAGLREAGLEIEVVS